MKALSIRGILQQTPEGYLILPATKADKSNLSLFTESTSGKYVTISLDASTGTKSYSQIKTAWALITAIFESMYFRKPSKSELEQFHDELLKDYAETKPSLLHPGEMVPVTLREMSKEQLSRFIQSLITDLFDIINDGQFTDTELIDLQGVFQEWESYMSSLNIDPTDTDGQGNWLSLDEYRATHTVSYASGRTTDDGGGSLEMAHIVSRGSHPEFADCCWNVMMLTHEEHCGIMHGHEVRDGGWDALAARFPHIKGRVERAYKMVAKLSRILEV